MRPAGRIALRCSLFAVGLLGFGGGIAMVLLKRHEVQRLEAVDRTPGFVAGEDVTRFETYWLPGAAVAFLGGSLCQLSIWARRPKGAPLFRS